MRLIGYTRVSSISQAENTSLEEQKNRLMSYAQAMGHELVDVFEEVGSGSMMDTRAEFQKAIEMMKAGQADGIIAIKLDRIGRNTRDILALVEDVLQPLKKSLVVLDLGVDTSTPVGGMVLTVLAAMAEMERKIINERTKAGREAKAEKGGYAYGAPRVGQRAEKGELVPDESEIEIIAIIRRHRRSGKSPQAIADYLNAHNYPTKRGGRWQHTTVRNILARVAA
ncbi:MAG: recombinase family protein [Shewanella sp.]